MGRGKRIQPEQLKLKLKVIREHLGLTLQEMSESLKKYEPNEFIDPSYVSQFEKGKREPSLGILLAYSKLIDLSINYFVDDALDLPNLAIRMMFSEIHEAARLREHKK